MLILTGGLTNVNNLHFCVIWDSFNNRIHVEHNKKTSENYVKNC